MFRKLAKNSLLIACGTLTSRIFGFIRDILIARFFGTSIILEAFIVAFRIPNMLRSVFAEGFSDAVAVPIYSHFSKNRRNLFKIANVIFTAVFIVLTIATFLGILFSRYLVIAIAPGFLRNPAQLSLAASFTKVTFFYLFLIGVAANFSALLYSLKKFFAPSFAPVFLNLSFIVGIPLFLKFFRQYIFVACVLVAGLLQLFFTYWFLFREGFRLKLNFKKLLRRRIIKKTKKLFLPRLWGVAIYQASVFIDTIFSSLSWIVGPGAVAAIYYANRIVQFPLALVGISLSRAVIVDLSYSHKRNKHQDFRKLLVFSFRNLLTIIIPVVGFLIFFNEPLVDILFRRGAFTVSSVRITTAALFAYSGGLFFFCAIKVLVNAFYSIYDTATPAKTAAISLGINAVLSFLLMFPLAVAGIALGSSIAAAINFFLLYFRLRKKIGSLGWFALWPEILKITLISFGCAGVSFYIYHYFLFGRYVNFILGVIVWIVLLFLASILFKVEQTLLIRQWLRKKIFPNK